MGKSSSAVVGYRYRVAYHHGIAATPVDAFLQFRAADKVAWSGKLTASGTISINAPNLFGGDKDQGGIVGDVDVMFGEVTQAPNSYLLSTFGSQVPGWRGVTTLVFKGGVYGAMNPYPQKPSYQILCTKAGWDDPGCWYQEKCEIPMGDSLAPVNGIFAWPDWNTGYFLVGTSKHLDGPFASLGGWWQGPVDSIRLRRGAYYATKQYDVPTSAFVKDSSAVMLLNMGGVDGSTDFSDDCGHNVTAFNGAHIITDRFKFGGSSAYFDGVDDYLEIAMGDDEAFGSSPWTLDAWVWLETTRSGDNFGRALFGYGDKNVSGHETEWCVSGTDWRFVQQQDIGVLQPEVLENVGAATVGAWAFVSICWDGAHYWMHQDGQLLTSDPDAALIGINPAHVLYEARTAKDRGAEPVASINDASFRTAADWFYAQGFGLCQVEFDPDSVSVDDFISHIEQVCACSLNLSPIDGQWYLDIANGVYDLASLPILTDDDILDWGEQPTVLDDVVNSVSVEYYDPVQWATVTTPPVQSLAFITANGLNHDVKQYHEIPNADLATRVAQRELMAVITPTRSYPLTTNRKPASWRRNTYFRLQSPKRGIADMVCLLAEKDDGTLKSGAVKITAAQDIYSLPTTSFVQGEPGVDTRPSQIPLGILNQAAFEAPYFQLAQTLSRADLSALPADAGYLMTVAQDPASSRDYTVTVSTDGGATYSGSHNAAFCPTALIVEGDDLTGTAPVIDFTLAEGTLLSSVGVGSAALWDDEVVRVDAIDATAGTVALGRGCADTLPQIHAADSRIWFFDGFAGSDNVEYTDAETIDVELLTNTGSAQLDPSLAAPVGVTFASRQALPYPPADLTIDGKPWFAPDDPVIGSITLAWANRDRIGQADQLLDYSQATTGPETGATLTLRVYDSSDTLIATVAGVTGTGYIYTPPSDGTYRIEFESERDGLASLQKYSVSINYLHAEVFLISEAGDQLVAEDGVTPLIAE